MQTDVMDTAINVTAFKGQCLARIEAVARQDGSRGAYPTWSAGGSAGSV
jgi:hypothetical protein